VLEPPLFSQAQLPFTLKQYQQEAVAAFLKFKHGTVTLPTGTGKTAVATEVIRCLQMRTAVIVPTESLLAQWVQKLREANIYAGVFYGKEKHHGAVTVFIINSASIHPEALRDYTFVVVDEVHRIGGEKFSVLLPLLQSKPYVLGLTSHLARMDGRERLIKRVAPVIYGMPIASAMKQQYISGLKIYTVKAEMTRWEQQKYAEYTNTIRTAYFKLGTTNPSILSKMKNNPMA
jgi:superfamily II DNA or RNA helicase